MEHEKIKKLNDWTKKELKLLPKRKWNENIGEFDSLIIFPLSCKYIHDSGYRLMDFIAVIEDTPICKLSGCSDVLHIEGIGGFGILNLKDSIPKLIPPKGWYIDCLETSGLLRIFCDSKLRVGSALSSFEVYGETK
jgi:hypothetical protein